MKRTIIFLSLFLMLVSNIALLGCNAKTTTSTTTTPPPSAIIEQSNLVLTPEKIKGGENITASIDVRNSGNAADNYTVNLKIDGSQFDTKTVNIAANSTQKVEFSFSKNEPGKHNIDVNGLITSFTVLKPAEIKLSNLILSPENVRASWGSTVTVDVSNTGEIEGSYEVILEKNGSKVDTKKITLGPNAQQTVSFNVIEEIGGTYKIDVGPLSKTLTVFEGSLPVYHTGDRWVYRMTSKGIMYTRTETITGEEVIDGNGYYVVKITFDPKYLGIESEETQWWDKTTVRPFRTQVTLTDTSGQSATATATYTYSVTGSPTWPMVMNNEYTVVRNSKTVTMASGKSSTKESSSTSNYKVEKVETISTNAGSFRTIKFVRYVDGKATSESWYSDKAQAAVKGRAITTGTSTGDGDELLSYSVKDGGL